MDMIEEKSFIKKDLPQIMMGVGLILKNLFSEEHF